MFERFQFRLRTRLIVIAFLATIAPLGILAWHSISAWNHALEVAQLHAKSAAESVNRDLWGIFRDYHEVVGNIALRPQVRALDSTRCDPVLHEAAAIHAEIAAITVRNLSGRLICSSVVNAAPQLPDAQMHLISETSERGGYTVTNVEWGPSTKRWVVGLTMPVRGENSEITAILFVSLDLLKYSEGILSHLPASTLAAVVDRNLNVAMGSPGLDVQVGEPSTDVFGQLQEHQREGFMRGRGLQNQPYVGAYVTEPYSGWIVASSIPEDVALAPQRAQLKWNAAAGALLSLIFFFGLTKAANGVAEPLLSLARIAGQVAQGDAMARAADTGSPEIREVSRQFNKMLDVMARQREQAIAAADAAAAVAQQLMRLEEIGGVGGFEMGVETDDFTLTPGSRRILELCSFDETGIANYLSSGKFITPDFKNALEQGAKDLKPWTLEVFVETAKGTGRWLLVRGEVESVNGRAIRLVGHIRDITDQKEAALEAAMLAAIVESSDDAIVGKSLTGTITSWNAGATKLFGYAAEEIVGQSIMRIIPPERHHDENYILESIAEGRAINHYETTRLAKDGSRVDVSLTVSPIFDGRGNIVGVSKIARDITHRRQLDLMLRSVVEASAVPYAISDGRRNIVYLNQAFTRTFGYEIDEIRSYAQWNKVLFPNPAYLAAFEADPAKYTSDVPSGLLAPPMELTIVAKDGRQRHTIAARAKLPNSVMGEYIISLQDVTDLDTARERLRESEKMEAFGRLASGIAHDFNNLLGIINSSTEIMLVPETGPQHVRASASLILRACERGADLTRRLLIFSRRSNAQPTSIALMPVLQDLATVLQRTLGKNISVVISTLYKEPHIFADMTMLHTALYNLAINARDAMPTGGTLSFTVDRQFGQIGDQEKCDLVVISVSDDGVGMPSEIVEHIFEPFFTTKDLGKGTGLGLSMVYGFVTGANGDIRVDSVPEKGTTFTLRFPAWCMSRDSERVGAGNLGETMKARNILLVEDDDDLRDATAAGLRSMGLSVHAVGSRREAMSALASNRDFDFLVTDFQLGERTNGGQLAREVEALIPGISVVVVSGYLKVEEARSLDPRWTLLEKPVTRQQFIKVFQRV